MQTQIIIEKKEEQWSKKQNFSIITYDISKENLVGPTVNLLASHERWMKKTNHAPANTKKILDYIEEVGRKFIEDKIQSGEIRFHKSPSPELEPKYYEVN